MKLKKLINKRNIQRAIILACYPVWITLISQVVYALSPKINSIEKARKIFEQEKIKLGIEQNVGLYVSFNNKLREVKDLRGISVKNNNDYFIYINKCDLKKNILQHELYHVKKKEGFKGNTEIHTIDEVVKEVSQAKWKLPLKGMFISESRANIYALTGLKL